MKPLVELYSLADRVFFEDPVRWQTETAFPLTEGELPQGWRRSGRGEWVMLRPPADQLPAQGWKIHVSATPETAAEIVALVSEYCLDRWIPFKFLRSTALLRAFNLKYAPRAASGKLLTIYPRDEVELADTLTSLDRRIGGRPGPYILTDLRYNQGPLYVRYGGFDARYCTAPDGERVLAIARPDGTLVPDDRRPVFTTPDWVRLPQVLDESVAARGATGATLDYKIVEAMHFSNGGGVYKATRNSDGLEVVLKEARPYAGLAADDTDAIVRLDNEAAALRVLDGVPGVPRVHDVVQVWEHRFLVMDLVPGTNLQHWFGQHYPLIGVASAPEQRREYVARALRVLDKVTELVAAVHERGMVFADLHPANIMISERDGEDVIGLVDFEAAFPIAENRNQRFGHAGFTSRDKTGADIDLHALAVLKLWLFLPLTSLVGLAPGKLAELIEIATGLFELPADFAASILDVVGEVPAPTTTVSALPRTSPARAGGDWERALPSIAAAITSSATPGRTDRLFPGDLEQFRSGGGTFAHGAAGVLWALHSTGSDLDPEHERWLLADAAKPREKIGFHDGAHGIAHVLDLLGHTGSAADLLARADETQISDVSLHSGLAGAGLNLLHLADRHDEAAHRKRALDIAGRLGAAITSGEPHGVDKPAGELGRARQAGTLAGLLRGWSGPALFLLRLYQSTQDSQWLELAVRAAHRDLDLCVEAHDGSLQVDGGYRTLPYLSVGSAGIALVADELVREIADERLLTALPRLVQACQSEFVIDSNLFHGRAGLMAVIAGLSRGASETISDRRVREHLNGMHHYALAYNGHVSFPGDGCSRLSMDVATGNAGVLVALTSALRGGTAFLPFLSGTDHRAQPGNAHQTSDNSHQEG
ncbi:class III lanthionine synthetase LanKC [Crossiella sp. CA198]|uniref:class III lanthionine synthetase LanKC n=1 Tax=Crossiella sp. CA198 TaxID=3455607 RepID=UPI003F8CF574